MKPNFFLKQINLPALILLFISCVSCSDDNNDQPQEVNKSYLFVNDLEGWEADFADYPFEEEIFYELDYSFKPLPEPLDQSDFAFMQSGNNHSDDLFMFIKREIKGLKPNTNYDLYFNIDFATNAPNNSFGVGGSPATSVYIKAGASISEPIKELDSSNMYRMNIDKGNQAEEGEDMINLGNFSNETDEATYALKNLSNENPFSVKTDESGNLWVILGADSGFESTTTIYYTSIKLKFQE